MTPPLVIAGERADAGRAVSRSVASILGVEVFGVERGGGRGFQDRIAPDVGEEDSAIWRDGDADRLREAVSSVERRAT